MKHTLAAFAAIFCLSAQAQNVGIGETSPANKLSVKGGLSVGSGYSTTSAPTNGAIIQGNVGIGTTSPSATLHILSPNTTGTTIQLMLMPAGGGGSATSVPSLIDFYSTFDAYTADQNPRRTASIKAKYSGGVWGNETLLFEVGSSNDAAIEPTERMRITAAGYVGIDNTNPQGPLDVTGRASASSFKVSSSFGDLVNNSPWYGMGMSNLTLAGQGSTAVQLGGFYGINFAESGANRMVINMGNVGIGTVNPSYTLDVSGTERVTGNLTVGGAITGRVWSTNLASNTSYGSTATTLLSTTVTSHGGTLVITGKVLDQTNNNNANRNNIYLYRTTSATAYNSTGSTLLDTWTFWQAANGNPINESGLVTYSETLGAGTYYYWLVGSCEVSGQTRTALTTGTRLIVYEF
jgi:hypothetical protein